MKYKITENNNPKLMLGMDDPAVVVSGDPVFVAVVSGLPVLVAVVPAVVSGALSSSAGADDTKLVTEINPMRTKAKTTLLDIIVVVIQVSFQFFCCDIKNTCF